MIQSVENIEAAQAAWASCPQTPAWRRAVAAATLAVAALCASSGPAPESPPAAEGGYIFDGNACGPIEDAWADEKRRAAAQACVDVMQDAKVAVINFGVPQDVAESVVTTIETVIPDSTQGRIRPDATLLGTNRLAADIFKVTTDYEAGQACRSENGRPSHIADTYMDLQAYDFVMGVSPQGMCSKPRALGIADSAGRTSDVFTKPEWFVSPEVKVADSMVRDIAEHEILHSFGLGHAGTASVGSEKMNLTHLHHRGMPLHISEVFAGSQKKVNLDEYGMFKQGNPMSAADGAYNNSLLPIQLDCLDQSKRLLDVTTPLFGRPVGDRPETIPVQQALDSAYLTIPLSEPMRVRLSTGANTHADEGTWAIFSELAIVPKAAETPGKKDVAPKSSIYGAEVFAKQDCTIVSLGDYTFMPNMRNLWPITSDATHYNLMLSRDAMVVAPQSVAASSSSSLTTAD